MAHAKQIKQYLSLGSLRRYLFIGSYLLTITILCGCEKNFIDLEVDLPLGENVYYRNGELINSVPTVLLYPPDSTSIHISWTDAWGSVYDFFSFNLALDDIKSIEEYTVGAIGIYIIVDGDQPGYGYNLVPGSDYVEILAYDPVEAIIKIRYGATFTRENKNRWDLPFPYRIECHAFVHSRIR